LLLASGNAIPVANSDRLEKIQALATNLDLVSVHRFVQSLEITLELLDRNVNPRLACEVLLLDLPRLETLPESSG
jgi:hypothetical protein